MSLKHGLRYSGTYRSWRAMKARCGNPKDPAYPRYGGRGITYDPRWEDFQVFLADVGARPEGTSLERERNNEGYGPGNCSWVDRFTQGANMRSNFNITVEGVTKCTQAWAREYGVDPATVRYRIRKLGWTPEQAVTTPKLRKRTGRYHNAVITGLQKGLLNRVQDEQTKR